MAATFTSFYFGSILYRVKSGNGYDKISHVRFSYINGLEGLETAIQSVQWKWGFMT